MKQHVQVYTDSREGWIKAIKHSPEKATAHDILEPRNDRAVKAPICCSGGQGHWMKPPRAGQPCSSPVWHREVHRENSFLREKYPQPHVALPAFDKTGKPPVSGSAR